ncbi:MAG: hypothetical protein ACXVC0_06720 [Bdellovibrionota bacterium]
MKLLSTRRSREASFYLLLFGVAVAIWVLFVREHLGAGYWYSDDAYYRTLRPFSIFDSISLFFTATDSSGYYRPLQTFLFMVAREFPVQSFSAYQWITIALILLGGAAIFAIACVITDSWASGAVAGIIYVFSATHLKPLSWVNQWYQASAVAFAAGALLCRLLLLKAESRAVRWLSLVAWYLAIASNNGIHSFAICLVCVDLLIRESPFSSRMRKSADLLALSVFLFTFIYVFHSPLERAGISPGQFFNVSAIAVAFGDYVWSGLVHFPGDARAWMGEAAPWYETFGGLALFFSSLCLPRFDRRFWVVPLVYLGGGFVVALHHHRWSIEYGAPFAFGGGLLLAAYFGLFFNWFSRRFYRFAAIGRFAQMLVVPGIAVLLWQKISAEIVPIEGYYLRDEKALQRMTEQLLRLDAKEPLGRPFLVRVRDPVLAGAPMLHYLRFSADLDFQRRLVLFNAKDFSSGEGLGNLSVEEGRIKSLLVQSEAKLLNVECAEAGCRTSETSE